MRQSEKQTFPKGSEWRRWDLHIHSPESILHSEFGGRWDEYVHKLFTKAIANDIAAIGITDYFFIEGYKKIRRDYLDKHDNLRRIFADELAKDAHYIDKIKSILILPNIEFRIEKLIRKGDDVPGSEKRLTLHVLFSDEVPIDEIEENFIKQLKFPFDATPQQPDEWAYLTQANLTKLGDKLRGQQESFQKHSPLYIGCMVATVSDTEISKLLHSAPSWFGNKCLIVLAEEYITEIDWKGAGHQARKLLYQKSDMMFSPNARTIAQTASQIFAEEFKGAMPCIWGSDAHSYERMFEPAKQRYCWIKADVTFDGLRQLVNEPKDRCYIGEYPLELLELREHRKSYIARIEFNKRQNSSLPEQWFDNQAIDFNPGMVAIIGNKGGGKSALADTLALLGNAHVKQEHFSFLKSERFRQYDPVMKGSRAQEFEARAIWSNKEEFSTLLSDDVRLEELERVRYLPQGYLEKLCNLHDDGPQNPFQQELDRVIFTHVAQRDRLGKTSLKDLIDERADEIIRSRSALKSKIRSINHKIAVIEPKTTEAAIAVMGDRIKSKRLELLKFEENKPVEVSNPTTEQLQTTEETTQAKRLNELKEKIDTLIKVKAEKEQSTALLLIQREKAKKSADRLTRFEQWFASMIFDISKDLSDTGIDINEIATAHVNKEPLETYISEISTVIEKHENMCKANNPKGYDKQLAALKAERESLQSVLDGPTRHYQRYLVELENWNKRRSEIIGDQDTADTLRYYEAQKEEMEKQLPAQLEALRAERHDTTLRIFRELVKQAALYKEYYNSVLDFIARQRSEVPESTLQNLQISFEVVIDGTRLVEQFFNHISQAVSGTFCGSIEGKKQLLDRIRDGIFNSEETIINFIDDIICALDNDLREGSKQSPHHTVERQLKKGSTIEDLYNLLFELDYLDLKTALKFGGKGLQELSPGERGLLLLVFYLLIDKETCPLIIDQPEENLDNQSIMDVLVPCMKDAKRRRQLFIVTHNPNIAVVSDSEQVIFASISKLNNYEVNYQTGSIEYLGMNRQIVNILEGTPPAFENRTLKYKTAGAILPFR